MARDAGNVEGFKKLLKGNGFNLQDVVVENLFSIIESQYPDNKPKMTKSTESPVPKPEVESKPRSSDVRREYDCSHMCYAVEQLTAQNSTLIAATVLVVILISVPVRDLTLNLDTDTTGAEVIIATGVAAVTATGAVTRLIMNEEEDPVVQIEPLQEQEKSKNLKFTMEL